jgi:FixJ family two-component response regulator
MTREVTISIVDDDMAYLDSISVLIRSMGMKTRTYSSADTFLKEFEPAVPGCVILDVRMPAMGGLALQELLSKYPQCPPIIILTGHAEVPTALRAIRQGAIDFLQKTFSESELYDAIHRALAKDAVDREQFYRSQTLVERFGRLTAAENDVLQRVLRGETNKRIAAALGISRRAVEDRRARMMQKLEVGNVADLVRLAIEAGVWSGE